MNTTTDDNPPMIIPSQPSLGSFVEIPEKYGFMKEPAQPFDFMNPPFNAIQFAQDAVNIVHHKRAFAVAAPQLGIPYRVFAMRGYPLNYVCFNPKIVWASEETDCLEESSLSCPGFIIDVVRPKKIKVRFGTPNGDIKTEVFEGLTARTFLHCMDFLDGRKFWHSCSKLQFDIARRKSKMLFLNYK
jgi:peptide deformylase